MSKAEASAPLTQAQKAELLRKLSAAAAINFATLSDSSSSAAEREIVKEVLKKIQARIYAIKYGVTEEESMKHVESRLAYYDGTVKNMRVEDKGEFLDAVTAMKTAAAVGLMASALGISDREVVGIMTPTKAAIDIALRSSADAGAEYAAAAGAGHAELGGNLDMSAVD